MIIIKYLKHFLAHCIVLIVLLFVYIYNKEEDVNSAGLITIIYSNFVIILTVINMAFVVLGNKYISSNKLKWISIFITTLIFYTWYIVSSGNIVIYNWFVSNIQLMVINIIIITLNYFSFEILRNNKIKS